MALTLNQYLMLIKFFWVALPGTSYSQIQQQDNASVLNSVTNGGLVYKQISRFPTTAEEWNQLYNWKYSFIKLDEVEIEQNTNFDNTTMTTTITTTTFVEISKFSTVYTFKSFEIKWCKHLGWQLQCGLQPLHVFIPPVCLLLCKKYHKLIYFVHDNYSLQFLDPGTWINLISCSSGHWRWYTSQGNEDHHSLYSC